MVERLLAQVSYILPRSLYVRHFGVKIRDYEVWCLCHLKWHDLLTEFHKNVLTGSEFITGDIQADRQNGDLTSLILIFKGSRLKTFSEVTKWK